MSAHADRDSTSDAHNLDVQPSPASKPRASKS
jgi:hypothetical protein